MKKSFFYFLFLPLVILFSQPSFAAGKKFGLGIVLGDPSALSGKYWIGSQRAIDMGLGWNSGNIFFFGDYLIHFPKLFNEPRELRQLLPYAGIGGLIKFYDDDNKRSKNDDSSVRLTVRIPLGLEWLPLSVPLGIFVEIVPGLKIAPNTGSDIGAGIGIRYYF